MKIDNYFIKNIRPGSSGKTSGLSGKGSPQKINPNIILKSLRSVVKKFLVKEVAQEWLYSEPGLPLMG